MRTVPLRQDLELLEWLECCLEEGIRWVAKEGVGAGAYAGLRSNPSLSQSMSVRNITLLCLSRDVTFL